MADFRPLVRTLGKLVELTGADRLIAKLIQHDAQREPTGFEDPEAIDVSYDSANRTITLTQSGGVVYWYRGLQYTLASPWTSTAHAAGDGRYFLMFGAGGTFSWSTTAWELDESGPAALAIVDAAFGTLALREVHGLMPWQDHEEAHDLLGTYRKSGGTFSVGTYAIQPASPTDADNTPGIDIAVVKDEDCPTTIPALTQGTYYRLRNNGGAATTDSGSLPFRMGATYPLINTGGSEVETSTGRYFNVYAYFIPVTLDAGSQAYRVVWLQPQFSYASLAEAQAEAPANYDLANLTSLLPEFCPHAKVTYRTNAAYTGATGRCRIEALSYLSTSRVLSQQGASLVLADGSVTNAKLAAMAENTIKARKTAGTGDPEDCTLSDVLDFVGSAAQGDILYRGASGWDKLPAGTPDYFLQTKGAGQNPVWAAAAAGGAYFWAKIANSAVITLSGAGSATLNRLHAVYGTIGDYDIRISGLSPAVGDVVGFYVADYRVANAQFRLDAGGTVKIAGRTRYLVLTHTNVVLLRWNGSEWQPLVLNLDSPPVSVESPTIYGVTTNPTKPSSANILFDRMVWSRIGGHLHVNYAYGHNASGSSGSGQYYLDVPIGTLIYTHNKVAYGTAQLYASAATSGYIVHATVLDIGSGVYRIAIEGVGAGGGTQTWGAASPSNARLGATTIRVSLDAMYPMVDW